MYFTILTHGLSANGYKPNDAEELKKIRDFLSEFPEIELKTNSQTYQYYNYYELKISKLRKLKILSLKDKELKQKLSRLQSILYNEQFIRLSENEPTFNSGTTGHGGNSGTSGTSGSSPNYITPDTAQKTIPLKGLSILDKLKILFEETVIDDYPIKT